MPQGHPKERGRRRLKAPRKSVHGIPPPAASPNRTSSGAVSPALRGNEARKHARENRWYREISPYATRIGFIFLRSRKSISIRKITRRRRSRRTRRRIKAARITNPRSAISGGWDASTITTYHRGARCRTGRETAPERAWRPPRDGKGGRHASRAADNARRAASRYARQKSTHRYFFRHGV